MQDNIYTAIGMMTGTSMDGLDSAIIKTDGLGFVQSVEHFLIPYDNAFHEILKTAIHSRDEEKLNIMEDALTKIHILSVESLLVKANLKREDIDVIGMHGQTVHHEPEKKISLQIGDCQMLADATGIRVVGKFRQNDIDNGGSGAPLIPIYHAAVASEIEKPVVFLNIGGVANITWVDKNEQLLACDTGMGNALLNDWIHYKTKNQYFDDKGKIAASGQVNEVILDKMLDDNFFLKPPPKSLDRNEFNLDLIQPLSLADGAATLVEFTVEAVAMIVEMLPSKPKNWFVCGGGRHNLYMLQRLSDRLGVAVQVVEDIGFNGDIMEAEAFAYMAVRKLLNLPISFSGTTGVRNPSIGGELYLPNNK